MKNIKILFSLLIISNLLFAACSSKDNGDNSVADIGLIHASQAPFIEASAHHPPRTDIYGALNHDEVIGVWISYIELSGILTKKTEAQFKKSFAEMMDNCAALGINTAFVHLRPFGDALYNSDYFPWSKYVTGTIGKEPSFDPLQIMLEAAHERGISFHGWLNPMRIQVDADIDKVSSDLPIGEWYRDDSKRGKYIVKNGDNWYLNPAYEEVTNLIGKGASEIAARYNIDGIHIDDYFYPTTATTFDADAFADSSNIDLNRFRKSNCNNMVRILYTSTKQGNPNALFGISPQGSIENNREQLYADVETWCKNIGYADYIAPQFYYGFENSDQPYSECTTRWQGMLDGSPVKLLFGLAVYKIGSEDAWAGDGSQEWIDEDKILLRQIEKARELSNYGGIIFFSYNWLFSPAHITDAIQKEINAFKPILR
ncbi:MAG: family 10 glycosylhydrolase [Oscillospiraceae bacterium]|nr:family 10 glycosylhydrolase [Oscillospiraceae bacterium]